MRTLGQTIVLNRGGGVGGPFKVSPIGYVIMFSVVLYFLSYTVFDLIGAPGRSGILEMVPHDAP